MSTTYDGALGTTVTVNPVGPSVTVGFDSTVVLVGPDGSSPSASTQTAKLLTDKSTADDEFGSDSEIAKAFPITNDNGAATIYGVSVDNGAASPDYTGAAKEAMDQDPRYIVVLTDGDTEISDVNTVVENRADDLEFARVFAPGEDTATADISSYSPRENSHRYVEVAPASASYDGESTYMAAAVAAQASRKPLGSSITFDTIKADSRGVDYQPSDADGFDKVTAVTKDNKVTDGVTTSSEDAFSDIFQMEIVDTVAEGLDEIAQQYAGTEPNTEDDRELLKSDMERFLRAQADKRPPLLADASGGRPFDVTVSLGSSDTEVDVTAGIDPVDVMKSITIDLGVGSVTRINNISA